MFSAQEAAVIRKEFWVKLGQYLAPIPSANGQKINWINYKTGVKNIKFKLDALPKEAFVSIDISGPEELRFRLFAMFEKLDPEFLKSYQWEKYCEDEYGKVLSRIYFDVESVSIYRKEDWPKLIEFFKSQWLQWDIFWQDYKEFFEVEAQIN